MTPNELWPNRPGGWCPPSCTTSSPWSGEPAGGSQTSWPGQHCLFLHYICVNEYDPQNCLFTFKSICLPTINRTK